ncbi:MAG: hypothetical protein K5894_07160 [Lachnospiraceae bacterium]|nr:hypothetical protein [Lachnospiraceae bacterium]MDN4742191.1 hypothetical protein [Lachnospiraceae bacterium C1.1]
MDSYGMNLVFDLIELAAGIYIMYNGIMMKKTGRIEGNGLIGKNIDLYKARDKAGFIKNMYPVYMICGFLFAIIGGTVAVFDYLGKSPKSAQMIVTFALLIICAVFAALTKRAQDRYLS